jgi:regulator of extracellular matrix RemA (YlzA/DUF370 family)
MVCDDAAACVAEDVANKEKAQVAIILRAAARTENHENRVNPCTGISSTCAEKQLTMKKSLFSVLGTGALIAVTGVVIAMAQSTSSTPVQTVAQQIAQRVAQLTTLLDLTSGQQTSAITIFTTEQTALDAIQTSEQTAHTALQSAITGNSLNGIDAAAATIGTLATQQAEAIGTGEAAFYLVLTSAQQAKYHILGDHGGPGAPGGQNGPPGPPPGAGGRGPHGPFGASGYSGGSH